MAKSVSGLMATRYLWLLPLGTALGALVTCAVSLIQSQDRYTAVVPFAVLPPPPPISNSSTQAPNPNPDDIRLVLYRQEFMFQQDKFLTDILRSEEFHPADKPGNVCQWLAENRQNTLLALKRDLVVVPNEDAGTFEIRFTTHDAVEAFTLVQAAVKVYQQRLQSDSSRRSTDFLRRLSDEVQQQVSKYQILSDALLDYQKRHGIDVLNTRFDATKASLVSLDDAYVQADMKASTLEQQNEAFRKQRADGRDLQLPADMMLALENDSTLRTLDATRLNLQQERAAAALDAVPAAASRPRLAEVDARLRVIDDQIAATRKDLLDRARARLQKSLQDAAVTSRFTADYISAVRKQREDVLTAIGQDQLVWQQRLDDLKEQADLVCMFRMQLNLAQANQATDDTRVSQLDEPTIPTNPSLTPWENLPQGLGAGFLLSLTLSFFLAQRHRRKLAAPVPATHHVG